MPEQTENYCKFQKALLRHIGVPELKRICDCLSGNGDEEDVASVMSTLVNCLMEIKTNERCPRCGNPLYLSDLPQYTYVCAECEENFG